MDQPSHEQLMQDGCLRSQALCGLGCRLAPAFHMECPKICVVEHDPTTRETFRDCLESEGYGVESFANGKDALERLRRKPEPCFVLLDLMMPVMNGAEFTEEFAKLPATIVPIPVYLCSATASAKDS